VTFGYSKTWGVRAAVVAAALASSATTLPGGTPQYMAWMLDDQMTVPVILGPGGFEATTSVRVAGRPDQIEDDQGNKRSVLALQLVATIAEASLDAAAPVGAGGFVPYGMRLSLVDVTDVDRETSGAVPQPCASFVSASASAPQRVNDRYILPCEKSTFCERTVDVLLVASPFEGSSEPVERELSILARGQGSKRSGSPDMGGVTVSEITLRPKMDPDANADTFCK